MSDHPLLPSQELASAVLSPVRLVVTWLLTAVVLAAVFWGVCIGLYFTAWQQDTAPLEQLFHDTLVDLQDGARFSHTAGAAVVLCQWLHGTLFVATGLEAMLQAPASSTPGFTHTVQAFMDQLAPSLRVVVLSTQVLGLRIALLAGMFPLLLLSYLVAYVDGTAERSIRRACAGRESANLYHRAKYFQFGTFGALLITLLCAPVHIDPSWLLLGFCAAICLSARMQWAYYKKYM